MEELLEGLDEAQRSCVVHPPGPLAIEAGPGSGKTRVLTARVAYRFRAGTALARRSLVVTFTRQAAIELRHRLQRLDVPAVAGGTVHALAYQLLIRHWADQGRPQQRVVPISRRLLHLAVAGLQGVPIDVLANEVEWAAARGLSPQEIPRALAAGGRSAGIDSDLLAEACVRYRRTKRSRGVLDFGDLLLEARRALDDPVLAAATRWRFAHVLVDEAQDLNPAQWSLITAIAGPGGDLCLIGDPDQAIYGWNGADARFLTDFETFFPGAARFRLSSNYRCPPEVMEVATSVLRRRTEAPGAPGCSTGSSDRPPSLPQPSRPGVDTSMVGALTLGSQWLDVPAVSVRAFGTAREEAMFVACRVQDALSEGVGASRVAVLARTNGVLRTVEQALGSAGVPCRSGRNLLDEPVVREALHRLEGGAMQLLASGCVSELRAIQRELCREATDLETSEEEVSEREMALSQLLEIVEEWAGAQPRARGDGLSDWLASALRSRGGDPGPRRAAVELSTFHRAKGLQWRRVFVVALEEGLVPLPPPADPAEERRLLYVALTRAEEAVCCTWAARRDGPWASAARNPSPFLGEMGVACPGPVREEAASASSSRHRLGQLRAQLVAARTTARYRAFAVPGRMGEPLADDRPVVRCGDDRRCAHR